MKRLISTALAALFLATAILPSATTAQAAGSLAKFDRGSVTIKSGEKLHAFSVELALTPRQQEQGLMFRRHLDADAGMLFVYSRPAPISMWMKNTHIPLDMLFIDVSGKIVKIAERTVPMSETVIAPDGPVRGVLELNAGTASRLGLRPGDRVMSPALGF